MYLGRLYPSWLGRINTLKCTDWGRNEILLLLTMVYVSLLTDAVLLASLILAQPSGFHFLRETKCHRKARKIVQLVKCLPQKSEGLRWISRAYVKSQVL